MLLASVIGLVGSSNQYGVMISLQITFSIFAGGLAMNAARIARTLSANLYAIAISVVGLLFTLDGLLRWFYSLRVF